MNIQPYIKTATIILLATTILITLTMTLFMPKPIITPIIFFYTIPAGITYFTILYTAHLKT